MGVVPTRAIEVTVGAVPSYVTEAIVEAELGFPNESDTAPALTEAVTVPSPESPPTCRLYVVPEPVTDFVVGPAVPLIVTSLLSKPVTDSSKTIVKLIVETFVGSLCPPALLIVTAGPVASKATVLSEEVPATLLLSAISVATPALMEATTLPGVVIPVTATVNCAGPPVTVPTSEPPTVLAERLTSPVVNPTTGSLNVTVKFTGVTFVGSPCPPAFSIVTVGAVVSTSMAPISQALAPP